MSFHSVKTFIPNQTLQNFWKRCENRAALIRRHLPARELIIKTDIRQNFFFQVKLFHGQLTDLGKEIKSKFLSLQCIFGSSLCIWKLYIFTTCKRQPPWNLPTQEHFCFGKTDRHHKAMNLHDTQQLSSRTSPSEFLPVPLPIRLEGALRREHRINLPHTIRREVRGRGGQGWLFG